MRREHIKIYAVLVVYCVIVLVFDVYGLDGIFSKYGLSLKDPTPKSFQYYFELLAVWIVKSVVYLSFCFFILKVYFKRLDRVKILESKNTILAWGVLAFIFFAVVLYGISRIWFYAPYSDLLGMVFYLLIFGLFLRILMAFRQCDVWNLYILSMFVNISPVIISTVTMLLWTFSVPIKFLVILFWAKNIGFIFLDVANPVLILLVVQRVSGATPQFNSISFNDLK